MKTLKSYVVEALANGKYLFKKEEALSALGLSDNQFNLQASRLYKKHFIQHLPKGLFMIIPPDYLNFGALPFHWVIDPLMQHLGAKYYVGLLSAASIYGATHQQPMQFQVIVDKSLRNIELGEGTINFHMFKNCEEAQVTRLKTNLGYTRISTKEQTILDLIRFYPACGYLSNVSQVVKDILEEGVDHNQLITVLKLEKQVTTLQRFGYIIEFLGFYQLADFVEGEVSTRKIYYTLLRPDFWVKTGKKVKRWKIILNNTIELEE